MVPGGSWALSDGTVKGTEFPACSVALSIPPPSLSTYMVTLVLLSVIMGGRDHLALSLPCLSTISLQVRWTHCVFFCCGFVLHSYSILSVIHPLSTALHPTWDVSTYLTYASSHLITRAKKYKTGFWWQFYLVRIISELFYKRQSSQEPNTNS